MNKQTFKEARDFVRLFNVFMNADKVNPKTKLGYAGIKVGERLSEDVNKYNNELEYCRIDEALTDGDTGEILLDESPTSRGYKFDKEGLKKVIKAEAKTTEKWDKKEVEFEPYYSTKIPEDLGQEMIEGLAGFIIDPKQVDELIKALD